MGKLFELLDVWNLIVTATIVTFVVSAFTSLMSRSFDADVKRKALVAVVSAVVTFLTIQVETLVVSKNYIVSLLLTWSFAVLFYTYLGKWTVQKLFKKIKEKLDK